MSSYLKTNWQQNGKNSGLSSALAPIKINKMKKETAASEGRKSKKGKFCHLDNQGKQGQGQDTATAKYKEGSQVNTYIGKCRKLP